MKREMKRERGVGKEGKEKVEERTDIRLPEVSSSSSVSKESM